MTFSLITHFSGRSGGSPRHRNRCAQTCESLLGFLLPLGTPKSFVSSGKPANRLRRGSGFFMKLRKLECDHGVAGAFIERRQLAGGICTGSRLADSCLNLSPIAHWRVL